MARRPRSLQPADAPGMVPATSAGTSMRDILTVTLNPALDLATSVDSVVPGVKLRCGPARTDPGGGGINVSRAIALLGGTSRCLVALAGRNGLTEGVHTKIKLLKRQTYGKAGFRLLRKRILLTN